MNNTSSTSNDTPATETKPPVRPKKTQRPERLNFRIPVEDHGVLVDNLVMSARVDPVSCAARISLSLRAQSSLTPGAIEANAKDLAAYAVQQSSEYWPAFDPSKSGEYWLDVEVTLARRP